MNKYELALVVSANVEDEVRNATVEQVKELITRFGGTITDPGTCEKKKLAYEIQHMSEGYYNFIKFEADRKSTRLNSSHSGQSRMPSSA